MLNATLRSSCSRFYQSAISRPVLLVALAMASLVLGNRSAAVAQQQVGQKVVYEAETVIARDPNGIQELAGAETIVVYNTSGRPMMIGFEVLNEKGEKVVQGEYGVDPSGRPKNGGRLIYKGAINYQVLVAKGENTFHLSYLELTTVKDASFGYRAYAIKAVSSDGSALPIVDGKIKFGDIIAYPYYGLSGTIYGNLLNLE